MISIIGVKAQASTRNSGRDIMDLGPVGKTLENKLRSAFNPTSLSVIDESHQHAGHAGAHPSGESHFRVKIMSEAFRGVSRVQQHRLVNAALAEELRARVHALAIETAAPSA
jgi:BolA family transcriptional regulator, general stress-responsive regulator